MSAISPTSIVTANLTHANVLASLGYTTFIESHGHSASAEDVATYAKANFTEEAFVEQLSNPENIYRLLFYKEKPVGFSKLILNAAHSNISIPNLTKLERIYLLKEYYGLKLGMELFNFNLLLSKSAAQSGMWLFVWKENERAIKFYKKLGFKIIGTHDFRLSATHTNPNYQMLLKY